MTERKAPIGIFDSGYGGLTVFRSIRERLPGYDYIYLGDNARAPYGNRSFEAIHQYTLECVTWLLGQGCPLIVLACNTASAKALRNIQQIDLPQIAPSRRVLGVIRPTAEVIGNYSKTGVVGIMGTAGTITSGSYPIEIGKFFPEIKIYQQTCPLWVPLIENGEHDSPGADYFIRKYTDELMSQSAEIDTILLACTHYPLLEHKIRRFLPEHVSLVSQGDIVAHSLAGYLARHPEIETCISKNGCLQFFTTGDTDDFDAHATVFFDHPVVSRQLPLH